ncbi:TPA: hypothetical protein HA241_06865 [Candidatus Woesearchaeota archaeon]|nr:hypothetical protein [Candidatus Woesearchaeota archaeon]
MEIDLSSTLGRRMLRAVPEAQRDRLLEDCRQYKGLPTIIEQALDITGTDNPYLAAENLILKRHLVRQNRDRVKTGMGRAASGQALTQQMYLFQDKHDPSRTFPLGAPSALHFFELFGSPLQKQVVEGNHTDEQKKRRRKEGEDTVHDFVETLEEVLNDPTRVEAVQSTRDKHQVYAILGLDKELEARIRLLDRVVYGNTAFVKERESACLIPSERGGLFHWLKDREEKNLLPEAISDIYNTLRNPATELEPEEHRWMMGSLLIYAACHRRIDRETAIGGYQQDLDFITKLPEEDAIIVQHGRPDLTPIRSIFADPEITLIEATRVFDQYPIDRIRREVNQQYHAQFQKEIDEIVIKLESLFITNGQWRDDTTGTSLPMTRLKETMYSPVLEREDYTPLRDFLRIRTLTRGNTPRMLQATPLQEFRKMVDGIVIAARKVHYLDQVLTEKGITYSDPEKVPTTEKVFDQHTPKGKSFDLQENFILRYDLALTEFMDRVHCKLFTIHETAQYHLERLARTAAVGLYDRTFMDSENGKQVLLEAKKLVPIALIKDDLTALEAALKSPLVNSFPQWALPAPDKKYVQPYSYQQILGMKVGLEELETLRAAWDEKAADLIQRAKQHEPLYEGVIEQRQLKVTKRTLDPELNRERFLKTIGGIEQPRTAPHTPVVHAGQITIYNLPALEEALDEAEHYVSTSNLTPEWKTKAQYLASKTAHGPLNKIGLRVAETGTWRNIKNIVEQPGRIGYKLFSTIEESYRQANDSVSLAAEVIVSGQEHVENNNPLKQYTINVTGTSPRDAPLFKEGGLNNTNLRWNGSSWSGIVAEPTLKYVTEVVKDYNASKRKELRVTITA